MSVRNKQDRISLWTQNANNEAAQMDIGTNFKKILDAPPMSRIGFMVHDDAIKMDKKAKDRYSV